MLFISRSDWRLLKLVLFGLWIALCSSGGAQQTNALQSEAQSSLAEARRSRSDPKTAADTLPITAPYHSIIGDRGRGDSPNSSDGVVPYWSSHLEGARSELIVPDPHGSYALPQTVADLKRILRLELAAGEGVSPKVTKAQRRHRNESGSKFRARR